MDIGRIVAENRASQNPLELSRVLKYVDEIQPKVILEIGAWRGYSLENWKKAWPEAMVFGIEKDEKSIDAGLWIKDRSIYLVEESHKTETLDKVKGMLNGKQIDFLYIDGDHTYDGVKRDYEMYSPLVRHGGIIGFHDICLASNEWRIAGVDVNRFWAYELIAKTGSKYLEFWDQQNKGTGTGLFYKP